MSETQVPLITPAVGAAALSITYSPQTFGSLTVTPAHTDDCWTDPAASGVTVAQGFAVNSTVGGSLITGKIQ
jgi:hypothetical protein